MIFLGLFDFISNHALKHFKSHLQNIHTCLINDQLKFIRIYLEIMQIKLCVSQWTRWWWWLSLDFSILFWVKIHVIQSLILIIIILINNYSENLIILLYFRLKINLRIRDEVSTSIWIQNMIWMKMWTPNFSWFIILK